MKLKVSHLFVLLALTLTAGCASIVDGGDKSVRLNSRPPGAKVTITDKKGNAVCVQTTPAIVSLPRSRGFYVPERYSLRFELPGYYPYDQMVQSTFNGWYAGNLLFGGAIGILIVDPATGAMWTLAPRKLDVALVTEDANLSPEQVKLAQAEANPVKHFFKNTPKPKGTP